MPDLDCQEFVEQFFALVGFDLRRKSSIRGPSPGQLVSNWLHRPSIRWDRSLAEPKTAVLNHRRFRWDWPGKTAALPIHFDFRVERVAWDLATWL